MSNPTPEFTNQVKDALDHLYDVVHLRDHPLAALLLPLDRNFGARPAQALRQLLLETIEHLNSGQQPAAGRKDRTYHLLELRYIEALPYRDVMADLGLSQSQYHRDQHHAIEAVAALLWDRRIRAAPRPADGDERDPYAEIATVAQASETLVNLDDVLLGVTDVLGSVAARGNVTLAVKPATRPVVLPSNRTILRQLLISLAEYLLHAAAGGRLVFQALAGTSGSEVVLAYVGALSAAELAQPEERDRLALAEQLLQMLGAGWQIDQRPSRCRISVRLSNRHRTLLIVDDNPDFTQLITRYLADQSYTVLSAASIKEGIELAETTRPDVLLLDVMLPEQDGWDALQALRHHPSTQDIPVLVCTVLAVADLALTLGASEFLRKPLTRPALLEALRRWTSPPPKEATSPTPFAPGGAIDQPGRGSR